VTNRRLLFVCPTCSPIGGLQTWLDQLCDGLQRRGWDPVVALVHGPSTNDSVGYRKAHPDLQTVIVDGSVLTMAARVREVSRLIKRLRPAFYVPLTVIDAHDAICEIKRAGGLKVRYVLSVHGNLPQQIADAKLFQPFADLSINPGALTCRLLEWGGMPKERVFHAPNGIERGALRTASPPESRLRIAYVGRLTNEDKRVLDLVGLVRALELSGLPFHLDIVGSGPCEMSLKQAITSESVTFHGFIESERLHRDYYPTWDVLVMFSQSEAFGLSLIEAMAHGIVPVSSRFIGSGAEGFLLHDQTACLFNIGDVTECAGQIVKLAKNRSLLHRISRQAHEFVTRNFSWDRCVDEWESALQKSLTFPDRPVPVEPVRRLDEGNSLATRFSWLPATCSDNFYKAKRRLFGIPEIMKHGEEWPLHTGLASQEELSRIHALSGEMDQQCAG